MTYPTLMTHVVAGYPSEHITRAVIDTLACHGSSYIEIQMPFSDPLADGPTIMHASTVALKNGMTFTKYISLCRYATQKHTSTNYIAVVYANTLLQHTLKKSVSQLVRAGMYGIIVPDLPIDTPEGRELIQLCTAHALRYIPVIAKNTPLDRLRLYAATQPPFVYTTQYAGVTGTKTNTSLAHVQNIRAECACPVAVGFGITTPHDVARVSRTGDIVVIGSALVRIISASTPPQLQKKLTDFITSCTRSMKNQHTPPRDQKHT